MEIELIKEMFNEERNIVGYTSSQNVRKIGEKYGEYRILSTDADELIVFSHRMAMIFDEVELARYVELAEELYDESRKLVSVYILGEDIVVTMDECTIPSNANFTIKLCVKQNPIDMMLLDIGKRIDKGERLSEEEVELISILPMFVPKEERKNVRIRCLKILNKIR